MPNEWEKRLSQNLNFYPQSTTLALKRARTDTKALWKGNQKSAQQQDGDIQISSCSNMKRPNAVSWIAWNGASSSVAGVSWVVRDAHIAAYAIRYISFHTLNESYSKPNAHYKLYIFCTVKQHLQYTYRIRGLNHVKISAGFRLMQNYTFSPYTFYPTLLFIIGLAISAPIKITNKPDWDKILNMNLYRIHLRKIFRLTEKLKFLIINFYVARNFAQGCCENSTMLRLLVYMHALLFITWGK